MIYDEKSVMKVGTDAVLLGAWINPEGSKSILDIGTGCGIIAVMMAQKSGNAIIDAIDIDFESIEEAKVNFLNCPWKNQLSAIHTSLLDFTETSNKKYDIILSNPPYFENSLPSHDVKKNVSKHSFTLPHSQLLDCVKKLISPTGIFATILPHGNLEKFQHMALAENLFCSRKLTVYPTSDKPPNRILLQFSLSHPHQVREEKLYLRDKMGNYTKEYKTFTQEFYPGF